MKLGEASIERGTMTIDEGDEVTECVFLRTRIDVIGNPSGPIFRRCVFIGGNAQEHLSRLFDDCHFYVSGHDVLKRKGD
jgi:hypothetical protein